MAKKKKEDITNVMRIAAAAGVTYRDYAYDNLILNAEEVAAALGQEVGRVFKTLVTVAKSGKYYVFMVPAAAALDLKKAAKAAGEKSVEMIPQKQLFPLTGYVHGGCPPIGMKRQFATYIDSSAAAYETIFFSAGKVGRQIEMSLSDLQKIYPVSPAVIQR
ncbi:MAG: aminoacyl-tRNA deacylase [Clostridia bacterium]|nr:aminoacyl-tRNA deacylase [Clostridia bacterium]